jgi:hypothetical protein
VVVEAKSSSKTGGWCVGWRVDNEIVEEALSHPRRVVEPVRALDIYGFGDP